jgi:predicted dithiol-disulfide oxidoreductase (DUF899 family)
MGKGNTVNLPRIVSEQEWLRARTELLAEEKEATRARDALSARRRELPMTEVGKEYLFEGPAGKSTLLDLFDGRRQLIIYHFMFGPDWDEGCPSCSFLMDGVGDLAHLHARDTSFAVVSRAPLNKIESFRGRMGWTVPWLSSFGSDFNYDFHVTLDEAVAPVEYNFMDKAALERAGMSWATQGELPGLSVFLRDGDRVFRTYSAFARGLDHVLVAYNFLDFTPLGRQEGREFPMEWIRHHDKYAGGNR